MINWTCKVVLPREDAVSYTLVFGGFMVKNGSRGVVPGRVCGEETTRETRRRMEVKR